MIYMTQKEVRKFPYYKRVCKRCSDIFISETRTRQICDRCKKLKLKLDKGYIQCHYPLHPNSNNEYVLQHRLIVEKHIERYLKKCEVVHHINEIKTDNRITNLMLFKNNKEHIKFHTKIKQFGFTNPIKRQIKDRWNSYKN